MARVAATITMETYTRGSGNGAREQGRVHASFRMEKGMWECTKTTKSMAKAHCGVLVALNMWDNSFRIRSTAKDRSFSQMGQ